MLRQVVEGRLALDVIGEGEWLLAKTLRRHFEPYSKKTEKCRLVESHLTSYELRRAAQDALAKKNKLKSKSRPECAVTKRSRRGNYSIKAINEY